MKASQITDQKNRDIKISLYSCVVDRHCFSLLSFLWDYGMHCRLGYNAFCNSIYVYTLLSKLTWHGRTECLSRSSNCMGSCCCVLELVGVCRASENGVESVGIKLDDHTLDVGIICKCVLPVKLPVLFRKFRNPSIPGSNIHYTFPTGTWPDTTIFKFRIFCNTLISGRAGTYSL
jgi:hypothetical protein